MPELPNFADPSAVVDWVGESLETEGWEEVKPQLSANGYQGLVDWFEPLSDFERVSYVADPTSRQTVVGWLAGASTVEPAEAQWDGGTATDWGAGQEAADWSAADGTADAGGAVDVGGAAQRAPGEPEPIDPAVAQLGPGTWDDARQSWLYYDPARGWLHGDGRSTAEVDALSAEAAAPAEASVPGEAAAPAGEPAPTEAAAPADDAAPAEEPAEPPLPELPDTTQAMVDEAIDEELAPVFDEAFSSIEGLDQLSPEDLREVLAAALAESGVSE